VGELTLGAHWRARQRSVRPGSMRADGGKLVLVVGSVPVRDGGTRVWFIDVKCRGLRTKTFASLPGVDGTWDVNDD